MNTNEYFLNLSKENSQVLRQQLKTQIIQMKVEWSFEWFKYISFHNDKSWNYSKLCSNPNVSWELIQAFPNLIY